MISNNTMALIGSIAVVVVIFWPNITEFFKSATEPKNPTPDPVDDPSKLTATEVDRIIRFCDANNLEGLRTSFISAAITRMKSV